MRAAKKGNTVGERGRERRKAPCRHRGWSKTRVVAAIADSDDIIPRGAEEGGMGDGGGGGGERGRRKRGRRKSDKTAHNFILFFLSRRQRAYQLREKRKS